MLNAAIWSTTGLRAGVTPPPVKALPCDFGPVMSSGQRRYQLQRLLGQGGFGQVYLTLDRQLSEEGHTAMVAIKILSVGKRSPWARERLIEEATKVRRISHPNVVTVMDRGVTEQDEDYIVYEFENVMVESIQWSGSSGGDDTPTESVSLAFSKVKIQYKPQKKDGSLEAAVAAGWDLKLGAKA